MLEPCTRTKKAGEHESDGDTNFNWYTWNSPLRFGKKTEGIVNQKDNQDHSD